MSGVYSYALSSTELSLKPEKTDNNLKKKMDNDKNKPKRIEEYLGIRR